MILRKALPALILLLSGGGSLAREGDLVALGVKYREAVQTAADPVAESYLRALQALKKRLGAAGDIEEALAVQKEIEAFSFAEPGTYATEGDKDDGKSKVIRDMRKRYRDEISRRTQPATADYLRALNALKRKLGGEGRLEEALKVQKEIERVSANAGVPDAEVQEVPGKGRGDFAGRKPGEELIFEIAKGVKMTFCWIPPGEFEMGSPEGELGRKENETRHKVKLSKGFWMAKTEVTQEQWEGVMGSNPSRFQGKDLPVETVRWNGAREFIGKVNASKLLPEGIALSLPTEAQWEYACRAGEIGPYSGGTLDEVAWYSKNSGKRRAHPVGGKKANAWGLHDMHGNVWEWCEEWFGDYPAGQQVDPTGPASGVSRVVRGGSWSNLDAAFCRAAYRGRYYAGDRYSSLGFRPAAVPGSGAE
jgi:formylglycine-generating enzyme required for sulfatase activity